MLTRLELDAVFHPLPSLESERLVLLPIRAAHANALFPLFSDPVVMTPSHEPAHATPEETAKFVSILLKNHETRTGISWVLIPKAESDPIGHLALHSISWNNRRAQLGFGLLRSLWRRGLMTEALRAVIDFSFSSLGFIKLCAQNTTDNDGCHQFLLSVGFLQEGLLPRHGYWDGQAHDLRQYGLLAPEKLRSGSAVA
jgi:ribosomal-protein-alanine N-acetyltransferase